MSKPASMEARPECVAYLWFKILGQFSVSGIIILGFVPVRHDISIEP
jgi:hypothetical protein